MATRRSRTPRRSRGSTWRSWSTTSRRSFAYYDVSKPWLFKKIPKGTHTLRAFPMRPWGESIKDDAAFASVTFYVGEKDGKNVAEPGAPFLTVVSPRGQGEGRDRAGPPRLPRHGLPDRREGRTPEQLPRALQDRHGEGSHAREGRRRVARGRRRRASTPGSSGSRRTTRSSPARTRSRRARSSSRTAQSRTRPLRRRRERRPASKISRMSLVYGGAGTRPCAVDPPLVLAPDGGDHGHDVPAAPAPDRRGGPRHDGVRVVRGARRAATSGPSASCASTRPSVRSRSRSTARTPSGWRSPPRASRRCRSTSATSTWAAPRTRS